MFNFNLNYLQKIKRNLFPFYKRKDLRFVFKTIQKDLPKKPKAAMFVGGCVRKFILNEEIDDIDIATTLTTNQIKEKFEQTKFKVVDSGVKHGTVTLISNNLKVEITTLRKDIKTDGRHAEIEYTENWKEDSERRDFTVNAIYLDIDGNIFDPQLGVSDLKNKVIKFIGDPQKRIEEDYLRIIRYIRFSLEYKSKIDRATIAAIKLSLDGIKKISKERVFSELVKILKKKNIIMLSRDKDLSQIFSLIFPEIKNLDRLQKLKILLDLLNIDYNAVLAVLLIDEKDNHEYFCHKYNVSNDLRKNLDLISKNFRICQKDKNFFFRDLKKNIYLFGKEHLKTLNILNFSENKKLKLKDYSEISNTINQTNIPKFPYDGNYLKEKGMNEGILMGKILNLIEKEWLNNDFKISNSKIMEIIRSQNN